MKRIQQDMIKDVLLANITSNLQYDNYQILPVGNYAFSTPVVSEDGEEGFATVTISIRGKDRNGVEYDGYADSQAYVAERVIALAKQASIDEKKRLKLEAREAKLADKAKAKETAEVVTE